MQRLTDAEWVNIFRNLNEIEAEVEVLWLDDTEEYVLAYEYELFEDGFKTEREAEERLFQLQNKLEEI